MKFGLATSPLYLLLEKHEKELQVIFLKKIVGLSHFEDNQVQNK